MELFFDDSTLKEKDVNIKIAAISANKVSRCNYLAVNEDKEVTGLCRQVISDKSTEDVDNEYLDGRAG